MVMHGNLDRLYALQSLGAEGVQASTVFSGQIRVSVSAYVPQAVTGSQICTDFSPAVAFCSWCVHYTRLSSTVVSTKPRPISLKP